MDKDMKAKVDEIMKDLGTRELSLDEMDKVVGGSYSIKPDGKISINGQTPMTRDEFNNLMYAMADTYGIDMAIDFMKNQMGYGYYGIQHDNMTLILLRFWNNIDGAKH